MKTILTILIFVFAWTLVNGQLSVSYIEQNESIYNQLKDSLIEQSQLTVYEFNRILDINIEQKESISSILGEVYINFHIEREIDFGYSHYYLSLNAKKCFLIHEFSIITENDKIIALKHINGLSDDFFIYDSIAVDNLIQKQKGLLGTIILDYEKLLPIELYAFGEVCSIDGSPPEECKQMLEMVEKTDIKHLFYWLKSLNPEIQAYGYEGLYFLEKFYGKILPLEIKKVMTYVKSKKRMIHRCEGCSYGITQESSETFSEIFLKKNYKDFKTLGYLK